MFAVFLYMNEEDVKKLMCEQVVYIYILISLWQQAAAMLHTPN
jgi:hypothetical protein